MESIILRRIHHRDKDCLAMIFKAGETVTKAVRSIPGIKFSITHRCWYVEDNPKNLEVILQRLNTIANVDQSELQTGAPNLPAASQQATLPNASQLAMKAMQDKLKLQGYSEATYRTYTSQFDLFLRYYQYPDPLDLVEEDITNYLLHITKTKQVSRSTQNQAINSIKFFYEKVARQERRTYYVERPLKESRLPTVLSEEEVVRLIGATKNLKHKLMLMITYAGGLRRSEVLNLRLGDVDPDRDIIFIRGGKGRKDRTTTLGKKVVSLYEQYINEYQPVYWLFEGSTRSRYTETSFQKIFIRSMQAAGIRKHASLHSLRHSFATHMIEAGVPTRYVQELLGHTSLKTTELYTKVTRFALDKLRSPLDRLDFPSLLDKGEGAQ